jgi:AcrR family transcriptional regulator
MQTQPRLHRVHVENRLGRLPLSDKQREREARIIAATQILMVGFPDDRFTIGKVALALRMTPAAIRQYFIDIETIVAQILIRHLIAVHRAIAKIPHEAPNRMALQRAAYLDATRHPWGGFTETHDLLIRMRKTLPEDLAKPVEDMRQVIGETLGGEHAEAALMLLDSLHLEPGEIEAAFANTTHAADAADAPEPKPAQPQTPATAEHKRHFKDWKAARREKSLLKQAAKAARAARAGAGQDPPLDAAPVDPQTG